MTLRKDILSSHHLCLCTRAQSAPGNTWLQAALCKFTMARILSYDRVKLISCKSTYPPTPRARGSAPRRLDSHFVLVAFECFGPVPPRDIANGFACWRGISRAIELLFFMDSKGNVRRVFWLVFCMPWARILLAFRCFGTVPPRGICQWFC